MNKLVIEKSFETDSALQELLSVCQCKGLDLDRLFQDRATVWIVSEVVYEYLQEKDDDFPEKVCSVVLEEGLLLNVVGYRVSQYTPSQGLQTYSMIYPVKEEALELARLSFGPNKIL